MLSVIGLVSTTTERAKSSDSLGIPYKRARALQSVLPFIPLRHHSSCVSSSLDGLRHPSKTLALPSFFSLNTHFCSKQPVMVNHHSAAEHGRTSTEKDEHSLRVAPVEEEHLRDAAARGHLATDEYGQSSASRSPRPVLTQCRQPNDPVRPRG